MGNMEKIDKSIIICGIICLTVIQLVAIFKGVNGTFRTIVAGVIAAAIGITIPGSKILKQESGVYVPVGRNRKD